MNPSHRPLEVAVASSDRHLLHEAAWVLEAVGYKVSTSTDTGPDAMWRRYASADFVLVDARDVAEPASETFAHDSSNPQYRIFLYDPAKSYNCAQWFAAGAHDALRIPLSRGELLTRLRTGARFLEFERRMRNQSGRARVAGMLSRRGLLRKLHKLLTSDGASDAQCVLLLTEVDWYAGIRCQCGQSSADNLVAAVARAIKRAGSERAVSAYLGEGRFATILIGQSAASAKSMAESIAQNYGSRESLHESIPRSTLSSAITPCDPEWDTDTFFARALETLQLAVHSGGNRVVCYGEINDAYAAWRQEMTSGNPFDQVAARDIMETFPVTLCRDENTAELLEALGPASVPMIPLVDNEGQLLGVYETTPAGQQPPTAAPELVAPAQSIPHDATFQEIYEAFSSRGCSALVVTADNRPLGYITCDGFLSMIDPVHADSFAPTVSSVDEPAYLKVPSIAPADCEAGVSM